MPPSCCRRSWPWPGVLAIKEGAPSLFLASLKRADEILELLQRERFEPHRLTLEITETEAARNPPVARALLSKLRRAGVTVSMDDYGMGFSNLERMRFLPFDDQRAFKRKRRRASPTGPGASTRTECLSAGRITSSECGRAAAIFSLSSGPHPGSSSPVITS